MTYQNLKQTNPQPYYGMPLPPISGILSPDQQHIQLQHQHQQQQQQQQPSLMFSPQNSLQMMQPQQYQYPPASNYTLNTQIDRVDYPLIKGNNRVSKFSKSKTPSPPLSSSGVVLDRCTCRNTNSPSNDSNHIPRPRNAFILFRQEYHQSVLDEGNVIRTNPDVSRELGKRWRALPLDQKAYWNKAAEVEKKRHAEKYPGYRYIPRRSGKKNLCSYCKARDVANDKLKYEVASHTQSQIQNQVHHQIHNQMQMNSQRQQQQQQQRAPMIIQNNSILSPMQGNLSQLGSPILPPFHQQLPHFPPQSFQGQTYQNQLYQNQYYDQSRPLQLPPLNSSPLITSSSLHSTSVNQQFPRLYEYADNNDNRREQVSLPHIKSLGLPLPINNDLDVKCVQN